MIDPMAGIGVTEALAKLLNQNPKMYDDVVRGIYHYLHEHKQATAKCDDPASVAHGFHRAMDELVNQAAAQGIKPNCAKGCAHCCHIEVHITPEEADLIIRMCEPLGVEIDWVKLRHQARADRWRQLDYKSRKCVFLGDDNACRIYEYRPMTCRKYMVASPPAKCNSQKYPSGDVVTLTANRAEIMASALFSAVGSETLPRALIKHKENPK